MTAPFLQSDRLLLRQFTMADVDLLVDLDADPDVTHFITGGESTPREEVVDDILPAFLGYYERFDGYGFWAVIEKASGEFLGWFHLRPQQRDPVDQPELGYRLKRAAWGKGYATEMSQALTDVAFSTYGAQRVYAETMSVHTASRRVMEKCGMTLRREFHQDWPHPIPGDEFGDVEYAIDRADWES